MNPFQSAALQEMSAAAASAQAGSSPGAAASPSDAAAAAASAAPSSSSVASAPSSPSPIEPAPADRWPLPSAQDLGAVDLEAYVLPLPSAEGVEAAAGAPSKKRKKSNGNSGAAAAATAFSSFAFSPSQASPSSSTSAASGQEEEQRAHAPNRWLLLAAMGGLQSISLGSWKNKPAAPAEAKEVFKDATDILDAVVHSCRAKIDHQDERGFSAVHWLIFDGLQRPIGEAKREIDETDGSLKIDLGGLARYSDLELKLEYLLRASEDEYFNAWRNDAEQIEQEVAERPSLMDLQDIDGNTPLHWAVNRRRVDLVAMLLVHRPNIDIQNKAGKTAFDMVEWDDKPKSSASMPEGEDAAPMELDEPEAKDATPEAATAAPASAIPAAASSPSAAAAAASASSSSSSSAAVHPLLALTDTSVYSSVGRHAERKWGLTEGLRIEQCSYEGESNSAAIKRLLFQRMIHNAVDAGDSGDADEVKRLVDMWQHEYTTGGKRMWPLVWRADVDWKHPLQIAVTYEEENTDIIRLLLQLPINMHVQSRAAENTMLHLAAASFKTDVIQMLLDVGCNVNLRDVATGLTPLAHISDLDDLDRVEVPTEEEVPKGKPLSKAAEKKAAKAKELAEAAAAQAAKFSANVLRTAEFLTDRGADPRIPTKEGNDCIMLVLFNALAGHVPVLQHFLQLVSSEHLQTHVNMFGNAAMHYALYQDFTQAVHMIQLKMLLDHGARADQPANKAGRTPLQVWAGSSSPKAEACASLLKTTVAEAQKIIAAPRNKVASRVIDADVCQGREATPVRARSEFARAADEPVVKPPFTYVHSHQATPDSEEFVETLQLMGQPGAVGGAHEKLRTTLNSQVRRPVHLIPPSKLEVRETEHKGLGLFATELIPVKDGSEGVERGIEIVGELISQSEHFRKDREYMAQGHVGYTSHFVLDGTRILCIDQMNFANLSRFINHSCDPNCKVWMTNPAERAVVFPLRDIQPGEEITIDYQLDSVHSPRGVAVCHCGARNCRKKLI